MEHRKVVVTGLGLVTAVGKDRDASWEALVAGRNGVGPIESFDAGEYRTQFAAEVRDFDPHRSMEPKEARKADRFCQFAMDAARQAMEQAGVGEVRDPFRAGVIVASGIGGMITWEEQHKRLLERGPSRVSPLFIPMMIADMAAGLISIRYGFRGANFCTVSACASGGHALACAFDQIRLGQADVMITGGSEATISPCALAGFGNMKALSTRNDDPTHASRPFDAERDGFVLGEGAGVLVLEEEEHARRRGAAILGEMVSYGATADAFHMTQPDNDGVGGAGCMRLAIESAGLQPEAIGYINAHGTSTPYNDKIETKAIRDTFGAHADSLIVSATKSMVGHTLGAAGGLEAAVTVLALHHGVLPPTINLQTPDPECDLDYCPNQSVERDVEYALSNSFGFGGHNVSLCFGARR
ncbi:MAG: beta-ketoacyl-ACP synthase II [Candidatus Krumholzibacteriia bacterium]